MSHDRILMEPKTQQALDDTEELRQETDSAYYWLGGSDRVTEGEWVWESDGSPIDRDKFWAPGRPDATYPRDDYLCIAKDTGMFTDCSQYVKLRFICEIP